MTGYPENTKEGLVAAIDAGYKILECDISRTKDGVFVLQHDATIDRCSNGTGRVEDLTYKELRKYDFGTWFDAKFDKAHIVTLKKILKICRRRGVEIELDLADEDRFKDEYMNDIYHLVKKCHMVHRTIFCAKKPRLEILTKNNNKFKMSVSGICSQQDIMNATTLKEYAIDINVSIPYCCFNQNLSDLAHSQGLKVKTWTLKTKNNVDDAIRKGADYIIVEGIKP